MRLLLLALTILCAALPAAAQYEAHLVADIYPGSIGSGPESPIVYAERVFFVAGDLQYGRELRSYDTATGQFSLAADINAGPGSSLNGIDGAELFAVYDGRLFFGADDGQGRDRLWDYDAATGQASLIDDVLLDWGYEDFIVQNDVLFFGAWDSQQGQELWSYSISTGQALLLYDINPDGHAEPRHFTAYDDRLFFSANDGEHGSELWTFDPASGSADLVADVRPGWRDSGLNDFVVYDSRLFFSADGDGDNRYELWAHDAATGETFLVEDEISGVGIVYNDRLFYTPRERGELWAYDATTDISELVVDLCDSGSSGGSPPNSFAVHDGLLFFSASDCGDTGQELWSYDAASGEATLVADVNAGSGGSYPAHLIEYDGSLFFVADDGTHGRELWALSSTPVANEPSVTPKSVHLHAPHPNPLRGQATITFEVADAKDVSIEVLDVLGRPVARLTDGPVPAGEHTLRWEPDGLPSGVYVVRLTSGGTVQTQRLTLVR